MACRYLMFLLILTNLGLLFASWRGQAIHDFVFRPFNLLYDLVQILAANLDLCDNGGHGCTPFENRFRSHWW